MKVAQSCLILCYPLNSSLPGSSVHGILQARILEWLAVPFSRGNSQSRNGTQLSCIIGGFFVEKAWLPTTVLLPGKSHGWRSLVGCSPWGCEESDTTEQLHFMFTFMHWRRKWQPTPVFLPGESQGRGSLVGCRLSGHTESDTTEAT